MKLNGQKNEKNQLTLFREKLLENNKLLIGSAAVVVIAGLSLGGITGKVIGENIIGNSRSNTNTSVTSDSVQPNQTSSNKPGSTTSQEKVDLNDLDKLAKTDCRDFLAMSLDDRNKLLDKLFEAGIRNHGDNSQDPRTNLTVGITKGCYDDPRTTINSFAY